MNINYTSCFLKSERERQRDREAETTTHDNISHFEIYTCIRIKFRAVCVQ